MRQMRPDRQRASDEGDDIAPNFRLGRCRDQNCPGYVSDCSAGCYVAHTRTICVGAEFYKGQFDVFGVLKFGFDHVVYLIADTIIHETIHAVIHEIEGYYACCCYDKIAEKVEIWR